MGRNEEWKGTGRKSGKGLEGRVVIDRKEEGKGTGMTRVNGQE
jgi:hypothetical protein